MKKFIKLLLLCLVFSFFLGCALSEYDRTIIQARYIYPEIPRIDKIIFPELEDATLKKLTLGSGEVVYVGTGVDVRALITNERKLKETIRSYEEKIDVYDSFYRKYQLEKKEAESELIE